MLTPLEWDALRVSLIVGARATVIALPLAVFLAWLLATKRFPGKSFLDAVVHAPMVLPPVVVGYLLLLFLGLRSPVGGFLFEHFGIRLAFTSGGASLASGLMALPLMVRAVRLSIAAIDPGLDVAARSLGATPFDRFWNITLPLAAPGIVAAAIIGFAASLGEFGAIITFAANVPGETQTLPLAIYAALQQPDGDLAALRLCGISIALAIAGLAGAEYFTQRQRAWIDGDTRTFDAAR
ncbi:MAG: molybdate ABC transporter permease subunit [Caulobacterales bacterium]